MIIFGQHYTFTESELFILNKNFSSINFINYSDNKSLFCIQEFEDCLQKDTKQLIVINTQEAIEDMILNFFVKLELQGVKFMTLSSLFESQFQKCYIHKDQSDISFLAQIKHYSFFQYAFKRFIDYSGAISLGLVTLPVILYSIYRIKKESPKGNVFYSQQRVGINGKEFKCLKFRSMISNSESGIPEFSFKGDPRIFKWGASMRKRRIDELPQLWNVLKGDMHLVGPRPERKYWVDQFVKEVPFYNERHIIKPGITGWAQTKYSYGDGVFDARQKLMYDLFYIKDWSIKLDLIVLWKTVFIVFGKKGI